MKLLERVTRKLGNDVAIRAYHEVARRGHFAAWEQPEVFASELGAALDTFQEAQ